MAADPAGRVRGSAFAKLTQIRRETRIGLAAFLSFLALVGVFIADRVAKSKTASDPKAGIAAGSLLAVRPPNEPGPRVVPLKDAPHASTPTTQATPAVAAQNPEVIPPLPSRAEPPDPSAILVASNDSTKPTTPPVSPAVEPTPKPTDGKAKLEPPTSMPNGGAKSDPPTVQPLEPPSPIDSKPADLPKPTLPLPPVSVATSENSKPIEPTPTTPPASGLPDLPPSNAGGAAAPGINPTLPIKADPIEPATPTLPPASSPIADPKPEPVLPKPSETPAKPEPVDVSPLGGRNAPPPSTILVEPTPVPKPTLPPIDQSPGDNAPITPRVEPTPAPLPTLTQTPAPSLTIPAPAPAQTPTPVSTTPTPSPFDPPTSPPKAVHIESVPRTLPNMADKPEAAMPGTVADSAVIPMAAPSLVKSLGPGWTTLRNLGKSRIVDEAEVEKPLPKPEIADAPPPREELQAKEEVEPVLHGVERNENFWTISRLYYGSGRYYKALWSYNRREVPDIRQLYVGTTIKVPPPELLDKSLVESTSAPSARTPVAAATPKTKAVGSLDRADAEVRTVPIRRSKGEVDSDLSLGNPVSRTKAEDVDAPIRPTYRVRPYDTLRGIAKQTLGDARRDKEILELNKDVITDPRRLTTGQSLVLPEDATVATKVR